MLQKYKSFIELDFSFFVFEKILLIKTVWVFFLFLHLFYIQGRVLHIENEPWTNSQVLATNMNKDLRNLKEYIPSTSKNRISC